MARSRTTRSHRVALRQRLWVRALENRIAPAGTWVAQGPSPIRFGQVEGMGGPIGYENPVAGAIHAVLPHPTDANTLYVGGTNGGIWKTTNAAGAADLATADGLHAGPIDRRVGV